MRVTILGCGGSDGVPMIGGPGGRGDWGACDPAEPRNRRSRASIHVADGDAAILVDTSPDMRDQLLACGIGRVTQVLYTHDHADHSHGINELRRFSRLNRKPVDVYGDAATLRRLHARFGYAFEKPAAGGGNYPIFVRGHEITGPLRFGDTAVRAFVQGHGVRQHSLGFRIGDFAYSTDVVSLSEDAFAALAGVRVWIVDCFQDEPHFSHGSWALTLSWIERVRPERAILTHMGPGMDYGTVKKRCPPGVEPGYDGMVVDL